MKTFVRLLFAVASLSLAGAPYVFAQAYLRPIDPTYEREQSSPDIPPVIIPGPRNVTADPLPSLDINSRDSVRQFYTQVWASQPFPDFAQQWSGSYEAKNSGDLTATWRKLMLNRLNAYRALAGVPLFAGTNKNWDLYSQEAAFTMSANSVVTHFLSPEVAPTYWTRRAAVGLANSLLDADRGAFSHMTAVDSLVGDHGLTNTTVGHRIHMFTATGGDVGIGHVPFWANDHGIPSANEALSAFALMTGYDWTETDPNPTGTTRERFVTWPNRGYFPLQLLSSARWSLQNDLWNPSANFTHATVEVYQDGVLIATTNTPDGLSDVILVDQQQAQFGRHPWSANPAFGVPAPSNYPPFPNRDVRFTIRVRNLTGFFSGTPLADYVYNVVVFDAAAQPTDVRTLVPVPALPAGAKLTGNATEVGTDIHHPNGNIYDQLLLTGTSATFGADAEQVTRLSYVDLNDDIVQVEFAGKGHVHIELDASSGPALPKNYNQAIKYMKGHARIYVLDSDNSTYLNIFSVGRANAVNTDLFKDGIAYDGVADLALVAVATSTGKIGGLLLGNVSFFAASGFTGLYAPEVSISSGIVRIGEIDAQESALPVILIGGKSQITITGGSLLQSNHWPVSIGGSAYLAFTAGGTSHGVFLPQQTNKATILRNDLEVTATATTAP